MNIRKLIPKHKSDFDTVEALKKLESEKIKPIIPDLLEWLQDMNWPIANEIEDLLIGFQEELIPHLKNIFQTNDGCWKFFLLHGLIRRLPNHLLSSIKTELERIKKRPTTDEQTEELDDIVEELLARI